jgi:hypothetical protein
MTDRHFGKMVVSLSKNAKGQKKMQTKIKKENVQKKTSHSHSTIGEYHDQGDNVEKYKY